MVERPGIKMNLMQMTATSFSLIFRIRMNQTP
jgi:hypothetical protein